MSPSLYVARFVVSTVDFMHCVSEKRYWRCTL